MRGLLLLATESGFNLIKLYLRVENFGMAAASFVFSLLPMSAFYLLCVFFSFADAIWLVGIITSVCRTLLDEVMIISRTRLDICAQSQFNLFLA